MAKLSIVKAQSIAVATRTLTPIQKAARLQIKSDADYLQFGVWMKRVDQFLGSPIVRDLREQAALTKQAHTHAVQMRDQFIREAKECKKIFATKRVIYRTEKETASEERRKKQEARLLKDTLREASKEAAKLRRAGDTRGAKEIMRAAENAIVSLPKGDAVPVETGFVEATNYTFEIKEPKKVPDKYWVIDESLIRTDVNAFGLDAKIPGVRVYETKSEHTRKAS